MTKESIYLKQHKTIPIGVIWVGVSTSAAGANDELIDTDIPAAYIDDIFNDERLFIYAGTGAGQTRKIEDYDAGTGKFTLHDTWVTNPDTTSRYQVIAGDGVSGAGAGDATAANQAIIIADVAAAEAKVDTAITDIASVNTDIGDFSGQGNLQSLLAALGIPDVLNKPLYTCLVTDRLDNGSYGLLAIYNRVPSVSDVILYPVAIHAGTTEITDDGTSPALYADAESGAATTEGAPNVHWVEYISHFEREGTINVISIFAELRWQHKTSGGTAYSKIQITGDGGAAWVDVTDNIAETNATYQVKTRIGVGQFLPTITAGASKLGFRLVSWEAGGATSNAKIRSDSYVRITYRKA
ncbi:MAG: hypothetical protein U9R15_00585 [Chloroflexota bacterium]|nr:hypothetical protein [Chloroflexota bacterium]